MGPWPCIYLSFQDSINERSYKDIIHNSKRSLVLHSRPGVSLHYNEGCTEVAQTSVMVAGIQLKLTTHIVRDGFAYF